MTEAGAADRCPGFDQRRSPIIGFIPTAGRIPISPMSNDPTIGLPDEAIVPQTRASPMISGAISARTHAAAATRNGKGITPA